MVMTTMIMIIMTTTRATGQCRTVLCPYAHDADMFGSSGGPVVRGAEGADGDVSAEGGWGCEREREREESVAAENLSARRLRGRRRNVRLTKTKTGEFLGLTRGDGERDRCARVRVSVAPSDDTARSLNFSQLH